MFKHVNYSAPPRHPGPTLKSGLNTFTVQWCASRASQSGHRNRQHAVTHTPSSRDERFNTRHAQHTAGSASCDGDRGLVGTVSRQEPLPDYHREDAQTGSAPDTDRPSPGCHRPHRPQSATDHGPTQTGRAPQSPLSAAPTRTQRSGALPLPRCLHLASVSSRAIRRQQPPGASRHHCLHQGSDRAQPKTSSISPDSEHHTEALAPQTAAVPSMCCRRSQQRRQCPGTSAPAHSHVGCRLELSDKLAHTAVTGREAAELARPPGRL